MSTSTLENPVYSDDWKPKTFDGKDVARFSRRGPRIPKDHIEGTASEILALAHMLIPPSLLPRARKRAERTGEELETVIANIAKARENVDLGLGPPIGFHTSAVPIEGTVIEPGSDGEVHFCTSLDQLCGREANYLYVVEAGKGRENDENLGWYASRAPLPILFATPFTPELREELGADFAECQYNT